ncbi:putative peptidoglycan binding domain protein [Enhygromyxa salina]|uniref:Putative peptidoglycan binding domain protein n=1 Tax=Enhygromyxa salina TaxID=215803 RepID=A0A2S9XD84_9BACT|nr:peptidoglycan-binding domain-containing protein [Enhygromyxa salina]PRP90834.1 putative peptidoglycan binding domain protein [Enhygromyxa salina]
MPIVKLQQGECLSTIALSRGFAPETVWDHGDNAELRERRNDPNALLPGDALFVPELEEKDEPVETDTSKTFQLSVGPIRLRVRLTRHGKARAAEAYVLELDDGVTLEGETDGEGWIDQPISITAKSAKLSLRDGAEVHELEIGHLDPHDEPTGVQSRLRGLGFYFGEVDGELGPKTRAALERFQKARGLERSGEADDATASALRDDFGG